MWRTHAPGCAIVGTTPRRKAHTMLISVPITLDVDLTTYAQAYGLDATDAAADARAHLAEQVREAVALQLEALAVGATIASRQRGLTALSVR